MLRHPAWPGGLVHVQSCRSTRTLGTAPCSCRVPAEPGCRRAPRSCCRTFADRRRFPRCRLRWPQLAGVPQRRANPRGCRQGRTRRLAPPPTERQPVGGVGWKNLVSLVYPLDESLFRDRQAPPDRGAIPVARGQQHTLTAPARQCPRRRIPSPTGIAQGQFQSAAGHGSVSISGRGESTADPMGQRLAELIL